MEKITALLKAFDELQKLQSPLFLSGLCKHLEPVESEKVQFNRAEVTKLVAGNVSQNSIGTARSLESYTVTELTPPLFSPHASVPATAMYESLVDENKYSISRSGIQRALVAVAREQMKSQMEISRAIEKQISEVIQTGEISLAQQINSKSTISYSLPAGGSLVPANRWNAAGADILGDIETICEHIQRNGSVTPMMIILGKSAWGALRNSDVIKDRMKEIHSLENSLVYKRNPNTSSVYHGDISAGSYQLEMFTYIENYQLANGNFLPYIDDKNAVIMALDSDIEVAYGGIPSLVTLDPQQRELAGLTMVGTTIARQSLPFYSIDDLGQSVIAGVKSRPLVIPKNINAFGVIKAIA